MNDNNNNGCIWAIAIILISIIWIWVYSGNLWVGVGFGIVVGFTISMVIGLFIFAIKLVLIEMGICKSDEEKFDEINDALADAKATLADLETHKKNYSDSLLND